MKIVIILLMLQTFIIGSKGALQGTTIEIVELDVILNGGKTGSVNLPTGRRVEIINQTSTKYKIRANGLAEGWVDKKVLEIESNDTTSEDKVSETTPTKTVPTKTSPTEGNGLNLAKTKISPSFIVHPI